MHGLRTQFDIGSQVIIITTVVLFIAAIFTKGLTHDLLLEAAVLLVSIKLVIMAYKNKAAADSINIKLDQISKKLDQVSQ
jgi:hypothetical protein